jgi:glycosyltransferase involved in cell wall biosynthesis
MEKIQLPKLRKLNPNQPKKKKILLLSDDLRLHSGIGTMSREFVVGTAHKYDWVQLGAAIKHPDQGKCFDISADVNKQRNIDHASVKIYPWDGYGNVQILKELLQKEKPDAILHFTDPRFWGWLYQMEHELRQHIPLLYYNIWDDVPYPLWNENYYESCDMLMNISRQTQNIVENVLRKYPKEKWAVQYVPHGVNESLFFPISATDESFMQFKANFYKDHDVDFVFFWNNRNIRRKQPGDLILAFKTFCDTLPKDQAKKCALFMHTQPVDENGTNLPEVAKALAPDYKIIFSSGQVPSEQLNYFYNLANVTINIASNEGFGISWCESLHAGTPIINNVTGGLQDGCRFADDAGKWIEFSTDFPSNHSGRYKNHGPWVKPVFPSNRSLQGSVPTPYIFDDRCSFVDVALAMSYWYEMSAEERTKAGTTGREWVQSNESNMSARRMSERFIECIETCFNKWTPRSRFSLFKVQQLPKNEKPGLIL